MNDQTLDEILKPLYWPHDPEFDPIYRDNIERAKEALCQWRDTAYRKGYNDNARDCTCDDLPITPHHHLMTDGESHNIRPDIKELSMTDNTELDELFVDMVAKLNSREGSSIYIFDDEDYDILSTAKAAIKAWKNAAVEAARTNGCPCLLVEPCSYACSCASFVMSGGCQRCARYGSMEQRKAAAERLKLLTTQEPSQHPERTIDGIVYVTTDGSNWTVKEQL